MLVLEPREPSGPGGDEASMAGGRALLHELRADAGRATLENLFREIAKLERIRAVALPPDLFATIAPKVVQAYRNRAAVEAPYELRRHHDPLRMTLLAAFCHLRSRELTDTLVDLLLELIHRIGAKAERKVEKGPTGGKLRYDLISPSKPWDDFRFTILHWHFCVRMTRPSVDRSPIGG